MLQTKEHQLPGHSSSLSRALSTPGSVCLSTLSMHYLLNKLTYNLPRHFKAWKFTGLLPWAALVFTVGYIMREVGAYHYDNVDVFISSICLVYAAP